MRQNTTILAFKLQVLKINTPLAMVNLVKYLVPKEGGIFSKGGFAAVFSVEIMRELTTIIHT